MPNENLVVVMSAAVLNDAGTATYASSYVTATDIIYNLIYIYI